MEKVCPDCLGEFQPILVHCPVCKNELVNMNDFEVKVKWPHCKNCETPMYNNEKVCSNCQKNFYLFPFYPKLMSFIIAFLFYVLLGYLSSRIFNSQIQPIVIIIFSGLLYSMLIKRKYVKKEAQINWNNISYNEKKRIKKEKSKNTS